MTSSIHSGRLTTQIVAVAAVVAFCGAAPAASAASLVISDFANPVTGASYSVTGTGTMANAVLLAGPPATYLNAFSFINPGGGTVTTTIGDGAVTLTSPSDSFNYVELGFGNDAQVGMDIDTTPYHYVELSFNASTEAENLGYTIFSYDSDLLGAPYDINGINDRPAASGAFNAYIPIDSEALFDYGDVNGVFVQIDGGSDWSLASISLVSSAPEPATWAMMLAGVFGLGGALRLNRRKAGLAAA